MTFIIFYFCFGSEDAFKVDPHKGTHSPTPLKFTDDLKFGATNWEEIMVTYKLFVASYINFESLARARLL